MKIYQQKSAVIAKKRLATSKNKDRDKIWTCVCFLRRFFSDRKQMLLQFGKRKNISKVAYLSGDRQFVPGLFLIFTLLVDSFPASCRCCNNTCNQWQSQIPRWLNKDPNGSGVRWCLWAHAGQSEPRIKVWLTVMADATTGKLFWAGQFEAKMKIHALM